jgi:hypothetical protein
VLFELLLIGVDIVELCLETLFVGIKLVECGVLFMGVDIPGLLLVGTPVAEFWEVPQKCSVLIILFTMLLRRVVLTGIVSTCLNFGAIISGFESL